MSRFLKLERKLKEKLFFYNQLRFFWVKELTLAQFSLETYVDILDKAKKDQGNYDEAVILAEGIIESVYTNVDIEKLEGGDQFLGDLTRDNIQVIYRSFFNEVDDYMAFYKNKYPLSKKRGVRAITLNIALFEEMYMENLMGYFRKRYLKVNLERYVLQHLIYNLSQRLVGMESLKKLHKDVTEWLEAGNAPDEACLNKMGLSIDVLINYQIHDNFDQKQSGFMANLQGV